jgi:hypothetical protein
MDTPGGDRPNSDSALQLYRSRYAAVLRAADRLAVAQKVIGVVGGLVVVLMLVASTQPSPGAGAFVLGAVLAGLGAAVGYGLFGMAASVLRVFVDVAIHTAPSLSDSEKLSLMTSIPASGADMLGALLGPPASARGEAPASRSVPISEEPSGDGTAEGDVGIAETSLSPRGTVRFGERTCGVYSQSGFVPKGGLVVATGDVRGDEPVVAIANWS